MTKIISWRALYQQLRLRFRQVTSKKTLVFYCGAAFHTSHIKPVLERYLSDSGSSLNCYVVCPNNFDENSLPGVECIKGSLTDLPKSIVVDVLISTEVIKLPYYFRGVSIYFGHGIGPKMNYQLNDKLKRFDYIFSPCQYFHEAFVEYFRDVKVRPIGLPILDKKISTRKRKDVLYAPSWCNDKRYISDIQKIIESLAKLDGYRVIVSLHPNIIRDMESGILKKLDCYPLPSWPNVEFLHDTDFASSFEVLTGASIVVGEISSVIFEGLAFNIPIVFDGNSAIYDYCEASTLLPAVMSSFYSLDELFEYENLDSLIIEDPKRFERETFANNYLINRYSATDACITELESVV